jgi:putative endonuclease
LIAARYEEKAEMNWQAYIVLCSDNTFYTGITTDFQRRFSQHASGRGAKYFRSRQPVKVVYLESGHTRSTAGKREVEIKKLTRIDKRILISSERNEMLVEVVCTPF